MGVIRAEIELLNGGELMLAQRHELGLEEVKSISVEALVDTGSLMLCINENIQEVLQLPVDGQRVFEMANGKVIQCLIVHGVQIRFQGSSTCCRAIVLPGDSEPLLGAIPMEDLGVVIDPKRQELVVDHNYFPPLKGVR